MFPGLGLSHEAFLTTAEFGTQELRRPAQMRLQVYRPVGGAGGTPSCGGSWGGLGALHCDVCWSLGHWTGFQTQNRQSRTHRDCGLPGLELFLSQSAGPVLGGVGV